jgi:hypothetical protein
MVIDPPKGEVLDRETLPGTTAFSVRTAADPAARCTCRRSSASSSPPGRRAEGDPLPILAI